MAAQGDWANIKPVSRRVEKPRLFWQELAQDLFKAVIFTVAAYMIVKG